MSSDKIKRWLSVRECSDWLDWDQNKKGEPVVTGIKPSANMQVINALASAREDIENLKVMVGDHYFLLGEKNKTITACRELMKKHQYGQRVDNMGDPIKNDNYCLECLADKDDGCTPFCAWAAQVEKGDE